MGTYSAPPDLLATSLPLSAFRFEISALPGLTNAECTPIQIPGYIYAYARSAAALMNMA